MPDKVITLDSFGIGSSVGAAGFVPPGFGGAGDFKIVSFNGGDFHTVTLTPDGMGGFDIVSAMQEAVLPGGPEGFVYIAAGNAEFANPSLLLSEWTVGEVGAYEIDANGNPIPATRRLFIGGLDGAEGAFIDPVTGDFIFSTFGGGDQVLIVQGFQPPSGGGGGGAVPEPGSVAIWTLLGAAFGVTLLSRRKGAKG
jgi:hypothetical protein